MDELYITIVKAKTRRELVSVLEKELTPFSREAKSVFEKMNFCWSFMEAETPNEKEIFQHVSHLFSDIKTNKKISYISSGRTTIKLFRNKSYWIGTMSIEM